MKKLINKFKKKDSSPEPPSRITSDTVAEHREKVLAGGRRFKYPIQYAKHRLVYNAIIIGVGALVLAIVIGWWQLYPAQNTSEFMYRVTKVLPLPVAVVDGQTVLYSDYLMSYRSSVYFSEQKQQFNSKTEDGKRQIEYIKQQSMREVIADAYALKLSRSLGVTVDDNEVDALIKEGRQLNDGEISQQTYDASILDSLGWSPAENRYYLKKGILRRKVSYKMDKEALDTTNRATSAIQRDPKVNFKSLATQLSNKDAKIVYGNSGWVPVNNWDGGLSKAADKLKKGESSSVIKSTKGDGYYIIRLTGSNDKKVNYEYIQVPLTAFNRSLNDIIAKNKIQKFISVDDK